MQLTITDNNGNISPDTFEIVSVTFNRTTIHPGELHLKTSSKNTNFLFDNQQMKFNMLNFFGENAMEYFLYGVLIKSLEIDEYGNIDIFLEYDYFKIDENIKKLRKLKLDTIETNK